MAAVSAMEAGFAAEEEILAVEARRETPSLNKSDATRTLMSSGLDQILQPFINDLMETYRDSLLSIILYGSAASGEYVEGQSNINCLVILDEVTLPKLKKCGSHIRKWREIGIRTPLFFDPAYIRLSKDVFPIEFLDIKERYKVLYGTDFLRDLAPNLDHLRFQCEQELKGKLLRLRQEYIQRCESDKDLKSLMIKSSSSFMVIFRALLHLENSVAAPSTAEALAELSRKGLAVDAMSRVQRLKRQEVEIHGAELETLFEQYLAEIHAIVGYVDSMNAGWPRTQT
jgi:predicted nucleotidyltransferase